MGSGLSRSWINCSRPATSPFSDRVYFPQYVDYYFGLDAQAKARLDKQTILTVLVNNLGTPAAQESEVHSIA